jgi:hypothetical protein
MSALPAPRGASEDGPRAYPIVSDMPPGHTVVHVADDRHWPHLKRGEDVLIDATDRAIVFGELYLVRQHRGPMIWQICRTPAAYGRTTPDRPTAFMRPLNNPQPRRLPNGTLGIDGCHFSEGPIFFDALAEQIIGRVVGLFVERPYDPAVGWAQKPGGGAA